MLFAFAVRTFEELLPVEWQVEQVVLQQQVAPYFFPAKRADSKEPSAAASVIWERGRTSDKQKRKRKKRAGKWLVSYPYINSPHRIESAFTKWIASKNTSGRKKKSLHDSISRDGFISIFGTCRRKTACRNQQRREKALVKSQWCQNNNHSFILPVHLNKIFLQRLAKFRFQSMII